VSDVNPPRHTILPGFAIAGSLAEIIQADDLGIIGDRIVIILFGVVRAGTIGKGGAVIGTGPNYFGIVDDRTIIVPLGGGSGRDGGAGWSSAKTGLGSSRAGVMSMSALFWAPMDRTETVCGRYPSSV
jgi:hypothetical protein